MSTLPCVELGVLGPLQVRQDGTPVAIPGAKPRAILTMLGLHSGSVVSADTLVELLWDRDPPRTADKALQTHISALRRTLGDGLVLTEGTGWSLAGTEVDASRYTLAARLGRHAAAAGDTGQAVARLEEALALWRGTPELPDSQRGVSEKTRWIERHAALVEDRADALLATGRAAEIIGELEAAVADAPLRERRWGQLMLALYRAGRQGDALGAYQRARALLVDELGIDPGPELRRLETAIVAQDSSLDTPVAQQLPSVMRAVTFLLTDIEGSTAAWEADADAMAVALARHDELVEQVVTSRGGKLIKTRGEGDATFSVFDRPSAAATAALELQEAIGHEPWELREPMRVRVALHTGEVELRDGDYFGRAVNRAARLRSLADGGQILCSGATAELVIDSLPDDVLLTDLGMRRLKNLPRPEHVFELRLETAEDDPEPQPHQAPIERPPLPATLIGPGPFVGRLPELERLLMAWQAAVTGSARAVLIAGEPGVGKTRLAGEWSQQAYAQGAVVLYGRCDEDLGAPYQPFAEALRSLVPCIGAGRLREVRGIEALLPLVPVLADALPDVASPTRADPDTERYALFDAVVALLEIASAAAPVVLILDDLHWAAKPTLLLLRHLLRFGDQARAQIVGTYRSTDLDRAHPLAGMLADLHRDGTADRLNLSGLDEDDVTAYVAEAGYDDEELAHALASVTGGNPFFLIEALRHVDESGGVWDQSTLPQGVREAVSRRLSRLPTETNKALAAAAVVGSRFALELVEQVTEQDLVDAFDEACKAGILIEEPGGYYRFNHALVRQSLLAELASVRRMRLHQRIAATLETQPGADEELLAELAYHYFECAWAGNAVKAVEYCRRAADQAMARLAYEGAADLYDRALHALEEIDDELPDRDDQVADLLVARCEALLAAGDVTSAVGAVSQLQEATVDSVRLSAWATCFDGELSMLIHPERLDEVEAALATAASRLAELDDAAGEAKAHTVRAGALARLGRIGDGELALDDALTAARRAREHRRVNNVLAQAPLAALWGPNPVPRAGGRCLDVVRLLRITTDSPAVEATSTRCQAVLEAFRGRTAAARRMIESARRSVTELGLRHALVEVEQFAGIVELVADEPAAAEPHLRKAYNGFRRMGLDADTAETAALLGRTCLTLGREADADELCAESERLAGHALKASIAWRTLRAKLLSRQGDHGEARRMAEAAVSLAEQTDALVDHGDACLSLAIVLEAAGDPAEARAAATRAVELYERKGAAALAERSRQLLGVQHPPTPAVRPEPPSVEFDTACVRVIRQLDAAYDREAWEEIEQLVAPVISLESRRKIVGHESTDHTYNEWRRQAKHFREMLAPVRHRHVVLAVRGERLALTRLEVGPADVSPGAPRDELLQLYGLDETGRMALHMWFDAEDIDAATAELDARYARLELQAKQSPRLENTAARVFEHVWSYYADRNWDAMAATVADNYVSTDRRRVVRADAQDSREDVIRDLQASASVGFTISMLHAIAIRGERLVLACVRASGSDPDTIQNDALNVVEIDGDERIVNVVVFEPEDLGAATKELDRRYLAGEAAQYARTWSVITEAYAALNRREGPPTTPDWSNVDHRRGTSFAPGEASALLTNWNASPELSRSVFAEAVHRLNDAGAVVTSVTHETSQAGFEAEWRGFSVLTVEGNLINRMEVFEETELDAAVARFEQLQPASYRLTNAASRAHDRMLACFTSRDWDGLAGKLVDDICTDDRRRVVNAGIQRGRDSAVDTIRQAAALGVTHATSTAIAIRGERLALKRARFLQGDETPETFQAELLHLVEIDADGRIAVVIIFDLDDIDAAFAELDARYLAGEAAPYAHTWSVIAKSFASMNRRELPALTPDCTSIDHRRAAAFAPGDVIAYIQAGFDLDERMFRHFESVHRLNDVGAVVTYVAHGTSREGFDAERRGVTIYAVEGEICSRVEIFDEADLDDAIATFDELSRAAPKLENAASRVAHRFGAHVAAQNWESIEGTLASGFSIDDRRRVVNAGIRHGRDAEIKDLQATAEVGMTNGMSVVVAIRGARLVLGRSRYSSQEQLPDAFQSEFLNLVEIDANERIGSVVVFDVDDFDAAMAELDARYLAGEAAAHADTWSVVAASYAALNGNEFPAVTADWVNIDHRGAAAFGPDNLDAYLRAGLNRGEDINVYVEAVHRLTDLGALITYAAHETSHEGFDAEWCGIAMLLVDRGRVSRSEIFDDADLDAAINRFDELSRPAARLENSASLVHERFLKCFDARDWDAINAIVTDDMCHDDRRRIVSAGVRHGRDAQVEDMRVIADIGIRLTADVIAIRGERLVLSRIRGANVEFQPQDFLIEVVDVVEVDTDGRIIAVVSFDPDDVVAAFAELDARYVAGEAAPYARVWQYAIDTLAEVNRHEVGPILRSLAYSDHRRVPFAAGDFGRAVEALWALVPDARYWIPVIHALDAHGIVASLVIEGTDVHGGELQWTRTLVQLPDEPRFEVYEEDDVDAALAKFEELRPRVHRPGNTASQVSERFAAHFMARDWDALTEMLADGFVSDDRRGVVGAGIRHGRDAEIQDLRAIAGLELTNMTSTLIATRAERLVLIHADFAYRDHGAAAFRNDVLGIVEINADEQIIALVSFSPDDIDAAFAELDARYVAGEGAAHAETWSVVAGVGSQFNRRELPATTPDPAYVDHRRLSWAEGIDLAAAIRGVWDITSTSKIHIQAVHRLSDHGAVITQVLKMTSKEGFDADLPIIYCFTIEGDLISGVEVFDEADIDAALARFEELQPQSQRLDNATSRVSERLLKHFAARDWDGVAGMLAEGYVNDDRRRVVGSGIRHGRDAEIVDLQAIADLWTTNVTTTVIATRGARLALSRFCFPNRDHGTEAFRTDVLTVVETNTDGRIVAVVSFDANDAGAAFKELDRRYLAGEAAPQARTWSVVTKAYAALNRGELSDTTEDFVDIDHRRVATVEPGGLKAYLRTALEETVHDHIYVEAVHRLTDGGAVVTQKASGTTRDGFYAEWPITAVFAVRGDLLSRTEMFDEADLDAALEKFDELDTPPRRLENAATRVNERYFACFGARNWAGIAETLAENSYVENRCWVVNAGFWDGRDAMLTNLQALEDAGSDITLTVVATRGERLVLTRMCSANSDPRYGQFDSELLIIAEIDNDDRIAAQVVFDVDDIAAAFEELDARYLRGEAARYAHTWSVIAGAHTAVNRGELPRHTPDCVNIDHRAVIGSVDVIAAIGATWDLLPDFNIYIEAVHRLTTTGAVVTQVVNGTSQDGLQAEWRITNVYTVEGDLLSRNEIFDEADLDAALARFDELDAM